MPTNKDYIKCSNKERASVLKTNASVTIEAAFAVPLFFFAMLCLIYLMELQNIKITLLNASQNAAKSAYKTTVLTPAFNTIKFKSDLIQLVGAERLEHSLLENGASSINCFGSYLNPGTGEINVTVNYKIRIPLPVFGSPTARQQIQFKIHSWTGYMNGHLDNNDPTIVYVTEHGLVWHKDYHCPHLQLSISYVPYTGLSSLRNKAGGKYHPCDSCIYGSPLTGVYITQYGNKYHNSLNCRGLKRTIKAVKKSNLHGKRGCSKCSGT